MENVDEEKQKGGKEPVGFIPTQHELLQIAKYWYRREVELQWWFFTTGNADSSEGVWRIPQIASLVGEEDLRKAIDEVYIEFRDQDYSNMRLWQIFRRGNQAQWDTVLKEYERFEMGGPEATARWAFAPNIVLTSPSFTEGQSMPDKYTSRGLSLSPPLAWSAPPDATRSLAITMDDLDSYPKLFNHWVLFNIAPGLRDLPEAIPPQEQLPNGFLQGENVYGKIGYHGPTPTSPLHRYGFHVYALDQPLDLMAGASRNQLLDAIEGHVLDEGNLTIISSAA